MIIITFGLPGSGKTFFANALSEELNFVHFNTDQLRKDSDSPITYTEDSKFKIYQKLLHLIDLHKNIVIDGTFYKKKLRTQFQNKALEKNIPLFFIEIVAEEELIKERIKIKRPDSDADFFIYKKIKSQFEQMKESHLVLTSQKDNIKNMLNEALVYIQGNT